MKPRIELSSLLSQATDKEKVASFALLALGVTESLDSGALTASEVIQVFFHIDNCLFAKEQIAEKVADDIMSRGVQLADIFTALPAEKAQQEFQRELNTLHLLCLTLLEERQLAA